MQFIIKTMRGCAQQHARAVLCGFVELPKMLQRPGMQRCAVSLAKESQQRTSSVLRAMAKGLRRPDQVPLLDQQAQALGLLRKMYQPCEHVPLALDPGAVVHVASVWERGEGDLVALDTGSIAAPKSALGAFALSAARARAGVLLTAAQFGAAGQARRVAGPAAKGLLAWRAAMQSELVDGADAAEALTTVALARGEDGDCPVEQVRREAGGLLLSSGATLPLLLLEECSPGVAAQLYADRVVDELCLAIYRGPEPPPTAQAAVGDSDRGEALISWEMLCRSFGLDAIALGIDRQFATRYASHARS